MRHLMSPLDFSVEELDQLLNLANDIEKNPEKYAHAYRISSSVSPSYLCFPAYYTRYRVFFR